MGMDQYLLIPFLGEWTSICQLFWCSPGVQGFDTLPNGDVISSSISARKDGLIFGFFGSILWSSSGPLVDGRWIAEGPLVSPSARRKQVGDHGRSTDLRPHLGVAHNVSNPIINPHIYGDLGDGLLLGFSVSHIKPKIRMGFRMV